jgi:hypothetical protein
VLSDYAEARGKWFCEASTYKRTAERCSRS